VKQNLWLVTSTNGHVTSSKILEHINKRVGRNVEYKDSIINLLIVFGVFGAFGFVLLKLFFKFKPFFINQKLWLIGSLSIYVICMAGVVYNIIHGIPFTNIDRNGNFEWYHSGSRS